MADDMEEFDDENHEEIETYSSDKKKHMFTREIKSMLYGFGDDENPYQESVELLEDFVIWFIQNMVVYFLNFQSKNEQIIKLNYKGYGNKQAK